MNNFLLKIGLFLLPFAILSIPADYFISRNLINLKDTRFADKLKDCAIWSDIYDSKIDVDVAVYGSSRASCHIVSQILEDSLKIRAYNIGISNHTFWMQNLRHKEYLKYNKLPKYIIYDVDIFSFTLFKSLNNIEQFLPYMLYSEDMKPYLDLYNVFSNIDYYLPFMRYYGQYKAVLLSMLGIFPADDTWKNAKGFYYMKDMNWNAADLERAKKQTEHYEVKFDALLLNMFEDFIRECKAKGIKLIFIYDPEYIEGQKFNKNLDEAFNYYQHFSDKYGIPFLNYSNDTLCMDKKYFFNSLHLNKLGAIHYTRKLAHDLKTLNLIQ